MPVWDGGGSSPALRIVSWRANPDSSLLRDTHRYRRPGDVRFGVPAAGPLHGSGLATVNLDSGSGRAPVGGDPAPAAADHPAGVSDLHQGAFDLVNQHRQHPQPPQVQPDCHRVRPIRPCWHCAGETGGHGWCAPVAGIELTKPLWAFWWMYQLENWIGINGLIWAPVVVFLLLAALPFLDRSKERRPGRRKWVMGSALVLFGVLSVLTLMVAFSAPAAHLG